MGLINHPVHIVTESNKVSPSAFIPFCEFGGNMSSVGVSFDEFDVPVCNSFQAKMLNDQICYEVDLNRYSNRNNIEDELDLGFYFIMDYNEDRQVTINEQHTDKEELSMAKDILRVDRSLHSFIYLNTIGKFTNIFIQNIFTQHVLYRACLFHWSWRIQLR